MTSRVWLFLAQEDFHHKARPMLGISLCTEAQAQRGLTAYLRSHRGKNRAEIQIQADLVNNANLGLSSGF